MSTHATDLGTLAANAVAAHRAGDSSQMSEMVDRITPLLWRIARAQGLSSATAEDAVQTTWLRLVQNADRIEEERAVLKWLVTTVRRESWALSRKGRRDVVSDPVDLPEEGTPDPMADLVDRLGRSDVLWTHVRELSARCRALLAIVACGDRPDYAAIAESLNMPVGSIGPTRGRCLAKLRAALEADPRWVVAS